MFVKVYQYHIQVAKVEDFLTLQERVGSIYRKYIECHTVYIQSKEDATKWMEITRYKSEEEYNKSIELINSHKEIEDLFSEFQSLLVPENETIIEENFTEMKVINTL